MLAAATSFFARTNISQNYNIGGGPSHNSRTSTPVPSGSSANPLPSVAHAPTFQVGPWKVQSATHKVNGKRVSVWAADKRTDTERMGPASKERMIEVLKAEVSSYWLCSVPGHVINSFVLIALGPSTVEAETSFGSRYVRHSMLVYALVDLTIRDG